MTEAMTFEEVVKTCNGDRVMALILCLPQEGIFLILQGIEFSFPELFKAFEILKRSPGKPKGPLNWLVDEMRRVCGAGEDPDAPSLSYFECMFVGST